MALLKKAGVWGLRFQIKHKRGFYRRLSAFYFPPGSLDSWCQARVPTGRAPKKDPGCHISRASLVDHIHMHCCRLSPQVLSASCVTPQRETALKLTASFHQIQQHVPVPFADFSFVSFRYKKPQSCVGLNGEPPRKLCNLGVALVTPNIRCPVNLILSRQASLTSSYILMQSVHSSIHTFTPPRCQMWSWMLATQLSQVSTGWPFIQPHLCSNREALSDQPIQ